MLLVLEALLINVNLYNGNLDMHGVCGTAGPLCLLDALRVLQVVTILFETPSTGNVIVSSNVQVGRNC